MVFENFEIVERHNRIKIYSEMLVQFENIRNENIQNGTPQCWDDWFLRSIDIEDYNIYFICTHTVSHGRYNRITDYKKVWGLNELDYGIYDNAYINDYGKVYFGIIKAHGAGAFRSSTSSTLLLVKKNKSLSCEKIFEIFKKNKCDFRYTLDLEDLSLNQVFALDAENILLRYNCMEENSLLVFASDIEYLIAKFETEEYDAQNVKVVYRKP